MKWLRVKNSLSVLMVLFMAGACLAVCRGPALAASGSRLDTSAATPVVLGRQGPQTGQFQANELTVNYKYVFSGNSMQLSGIVQFATPIVANYSVVRTFELGLALADAQGNVLGQQSLTTAYDTDVNDSVKFTGTILVPSQAASMVFTYSGQAYGPGSTPTNFWLDPIKK
jgi:hypothetical protein